MPDERDDLFARFAVELGYVSSEQLDGALTTQRTVAELGLVESVSHVLVAKRIITHEQHQDIENRIAMQSGEARIVGGYEVIEKLGQGGMGAVYKARRVEDRLLVALKILPPSLATPTYVARFRREADIVRSLEHPNIVGYVEFGHDSKRDCYYCALELIDGEDVASMIGRLGQLRQSDTVVIARQIADALQHAYNHGLVHRDVKPANIILTPSGIAKLLDLGLARPATDPSARYTQAGVFVGSPDYASPEQSRGDQDLDAQSDIYSLGASMYHMATGKPPFSGGTALEVLRRHLTVKPVPPIQINPKISRGLNEIILKALAKNPADRYETPKRLVDDLARLEGGRQPTASVEVSLVKRAAVAKLRRLRTTKHAPKIQAQPWGMIVAAGLGAAMLLISIWLLLSSGQDRHEADLAVPATLLPPPLPVPTDLGLPPLAKASAETGPSKNVETASSVFELAEKFRNENPDRHAECAAKYQTVIDRFGDSPQAAHSRLRLAEIVEARTPSTVAQAIEPTFPEPVVPVTVWLEGELPEKHTFARHSWYDDVDYDLFSANDWLSHYSHEAPGKVVYTFDMQTSARYAFHIRANPMSETLQWQLDWSDWETVDFSAVPKDSYVNVASERDHRYLAWVKVGELTLRNGTHRLELRCSGGPGNHGAIDCICFTTDRSFVASGPARPDGVGDVAGGRAFRSNSPPTGPPDDAQFLGGNAYKLFRPLRWAEAQRACVQMGGHLATLGHRYEMSLAKALASDAIKDVWIGLQWDEASASWKWIDGEAVARDDWAAPAIARRAPSGGAAGALSVDSNLSWDAKSKTSNNYFICEWDDVDMQPATALLYNGESHQGQGGRSANENNHIREQTMQAHSGRTALEWSYEGTGWGATWWRWADRNSTARNTEMGRFSKLTFWMKFVGDAASSSISVAVSSNQTIQTGSSRAEIPVNVLDGSWHKVEIPTMTFVRYVDDENRTRDALFDPNRVRLFHIGAWSRSKMSFRIYIDDLTFVN